MNGDVLTLALLAVLVLLVAAGWIVLTEERPRRAPEPSVVWMRPVDHRIAHAFRAAELHTELPDVAALAFCSWWPVAAPVPAAELVPDDTAPRCVSERWNGWSIAANDPGRLARDVDSAPGALFNAPTSKASKECVRCVYGLDSHRVR